MMNSAAKPEFRSFATTIVCNVVTIESFHCADCEPALSAII